MKTLLVMRHAKSDWGAAAASDHQRPLAPRGVMAARRMGEFIAEAGAIPDLIVSSPAVRALTTVELASEAGRWACPIVTAPELYASNPARVLEIVAAVDGGPTRVLIAGHEPTWSSLVGGLIGGGRVRMPTAATACIDFAVNAWDRIEWGRGELRWLVIPKMLRGSPQEVNRSQ